MLFSSNDNSILLDSYSSLIPTFSNFNEEYIREYVLTSNTPQVVIFDDIVLNSYYHSNTFQEMLHAKHISMIFTLQYPSDKLLTLPIYNDNQINTSLSFFTSGMCLTDTHKIHSLFEITNIRHGNENTPYEYYESSTISPNV